MALSAYLNPYRLKKALMKPRTYFMRRRESHQTGFIKSALELHYYRPAFYKFIGATIANKHILHEADLTADSIVLDVGAFTGEWAQHIIQRYNPNILAFEPDPKNYAALLQKAEIYPKLKPLRYGLADKDEVMQISISSMGSSLFENPNSPSGSDTAEVQIHAIDSAWKMLELGTVDLMKINIEGAEFPLLERMIQCDMLKNVDSFMIQFHEWHPGAYHRRRKIRKALAKTHNCVWDYHFVWEKWDKKV
ncbi:FkbM family methyltransferase [Ketobacter sp. MCCC 1A13808]|uniref:FkbM family methyltransferase n=1 Tax=Ketobacter sp. MCCC 1A13808 TaxID=2602738 RepID=UPI0012EBCABC|nr:FkbM family methyltransferase [Ketobacter sp. MCCC 1A13808]MVF13770.1 FkbM family methyltransferase [Ketobacter sp. MCCC 1A13808]